MSRGLTLARLQQLVLAWLVARRVLAAWRAVRARGLTDIWREAWRSCLRLAYQLALRLPSAQRKLGLELAKARMQLIDSVAPTFPDLPKHYALPALGRSNDDIRRELDRLAGLHGSDWQRGRVSGAVYFGDEGPTPWVALPSGIEKQGLMSGLARS